MKTVSVIGLGNRGTEYMAFMKYFHKTKVKVVSICDINSQAIIDFKPKYKIDDSLCFTNTKDFFKKGVISDGLIIATQDKSHFEICKEAILTGYKKILMEKPVSDNIIECAELNRLSKENNVDLVICHVLRYSNFFRKIKDIIRSQEIGNIINIDHIENVGFFHFAHSYVRGNWKKESDSTPSLLAKCCHDIDLISWFMDSECESVSSYGDLRYFNKNNAPKGATEYCLKGCPHLKECPYNPEWTYITAPFYKATFIKYNHRTMTGKCNATKKEMYDCLNNTSYGKCVYLNDNDVCDIQNVFMKFENGATATHTLNAFSNKMYRSGRIMGSKGEIIYSGNSLKVNIFGGKHYHINPSNPFIPGHGEGDIKIIKHFVDILYDKYENKEDITFIDETIKSHKIVMAAEYSRHNDSKLVKIKELYK